MTGRELIKWIQENKAEDLPVAFDYSAYETERIEVENVSIEDDTDVIWSDVRKPHIHLG